MAKMIYCFCPKCKERVHNYIQKGATVERKMHCFECDTKFKVYIKDLQQK